MVSFGELVGWTGTESPLQIALLISPSLDSEIVDIIRQAINPQDIIATIGMPGAVANYTTRTSPSELRAVLANTGRPDGFSLVIAHAYVPGIMSLVTQLAEINIESQMLPMSNAEIGRAMENQNIQLALITWLTGDDRQAWIDRFDETHVVDLYSLPISYRAIPELRITLSENGWPLASW